MRHSTIVCATAAVCLLGLAACQEELLVAPGAKGTVEILARMDGEINTRTCVGSSTADGTVGILWMPGDRIGVYGEDGTQNAPFASANTGAVAEAIFTGNLQQGEKPAYAYYPYSEDNAAASVSAIKGNLKLTQTYDMGTGRIEGDYKVGAPSFTSADGKSYGFTFSHLFSLLRFDIDATGTALEGDNLESIILTLPEGRRLGGEFTFDAASREVTWTGAADGARTLTMNWSDTPALTDGARYSGYITCAPDVRQGDEIKITILTRRYRAEFTRMALTDFAANAQTTEDKEIATALGDFDWTAFEEKASTLRIVGRSDIEHWLARNRANLGNDAEGTEKELHYRHGFGNLALINENDNSSLGNGSPAGKAEIVLQRMSNPTPKLLWLAVLSQKFPGLTGRHVQGLTKLWSDYIGTYPFA